MTRNFKLTLTSNVLTYNLLTLIKLDVQVTGDLDWPFPDQVHSIILQAENGAFRLTKSGGTDGPIVNDGEASSDVGVSNSLACSDYNMRGDTNGMFVNVEVNAS